MSPTYAALLAVCRGYYRDETSCISNPPPNWADWSNWSDFGPYQLSKWILCSGKKIKLRSSGTPKQILLISPPPLIRYCSIDCNNLVFFDNMTWKTNYKRFFDIQGNGGRGREEMDGENFFASKIFHEHQTMWKKLLKIITNRNTIRMKKIDTNARNFVENKLKIDLKFEKKKCC